MRIVRRLGLVVVGGLLGAGVVLWMRPVEARQDPRDPAPAGPRLTIIEAGVLATPYRLKFVRDSKSDGCWLAGYGDPRGIEPGQALALVVAPKEACQQ
jgi:hypothetical protein